MSSRDIFRSRCFAQGGVQVDVSVEATWALGVDADFDGAGGRREEGRQRLSRVIRSKRLYLYLVFHPTSLPYARTLLHPGAAGPPRQACSGSMGGKIEKNRSITAKEHSGD